jgi:hypothetical protein
MNANGSNQQRLTNTPTVWEGSPKWSPDGEIIVFDAYDYNIQSGSGSPSQIFTIKADGSNQTRLTNLGSDDPAWSPDGKKILFSSGRDGNLEIYIMNSDGTNQKNISNNPASDLYPSWRVPIVTAISTLPPVSPITWQKTFGTEFGDYPDSVQQTADGGYIIAARTISPTEEHIYLIKIDAYGKEQWSKTFGNDPEDSCSASAIKQTADAGYIISGVKYSRSSDFLSSCQFYLIKTNGSGNEEWSKTFGHGRAWDVGHTVDGGYIVGGLLFTGIGYSSNGILIKTDQGGNELWSRKFNGIKEIGEVHQTVDGGYIAIGDKCLLKTDQMGNELWRKTLEYDRGITMQETTNGEYVIAGLKYLNNNTTDVYLIKCDVTGNVLWSRNFSNSSIFRVSALQTNDGGYIIGVYSKTYGISLIKTDNNGNELWHRTFANLGEGAAWALQTADSGYAIAAGGPGNGELDVWVIKTDTEGNLK